MNSEVKITDENTEAVTAEVEEVEAKAEKKPSKFKKLRAEYGYLTAAFLLPALLMWLIYIAMETYPFGDGSVLVLDLNGQYVYFFEGLRNIIRGGGSFIYTFSRALGGEFMGIFAYYLASPFAFLTALFPDGTMTEALLVMFLCKCGLTGVTFSYYIHKTRPNANRIATIVFSSMYALSAYAVVQQHNTMWIDCVIYLPLLALGVEELIKYGKYKRFVIVLALAILSNFYIGYMMCIFVAVYFFCYWYAHSTDGQNNPENEPKHFLRSLIRIALYSLLGVGIASIIIFTAYYSLKFGKTTFSNPTYAFSQQWDFLDIFTKLFPGSYDTVRPEGTPFIYCGVFTLLMAPAYFTCKDISSREKTAYGILLAIFVLSFNISAVDMFWHGLQRPNWLNCRYSFMFCFILLVMGFRAYEHIKEIKFGTLYGISAFYLLALLVIQKLDYESMPDIDAIWLSIACVIVYLIASRAAARSDSANHASMVILVLVCLELFTAGMLNVMDLDEDVHYSSRSSYQSYIDTWKPAFDALKEYDDGFYRSEKTSHLKTNDSMSIDYNGLSGSTSTLNASTIKFLAKMGIASKSHWSKYLGGNPATDSLLGIKYLLSDNTVSDLYKVAFTAKDEDKEITAYENPYALSIATAASENIASLHMDNYANPFDYMNAMITYLTGSDHELEVFVPMRMTHSTEENLTISYVVGHKKYSPDGTSGDPTLSYSFEVPDKEVQLYAYIATEYPRSCKMRVNGRSNGTYFGNETMRIVEVGKKGDYISSETDEIKLEFVLEEDCVYIANQGSNYLYYLDEEVFKEAMLSLRENSFEIEDGYSEDHLKGTITTTKDRSTVFTTIAYDKGWIVKVDGVEVETYELTDALIGFDVAAAGTHTLEFTYRPKALVLGIAVSVISLLLFVLICVIDFLIKKKKREAGEESVAAVLFPLPLKESLEVIELDGDGTEVPMPEGTEADVTEAVEAEAEAEVEAEAEADATAAETEKEEDR